MPYTLDDAEQRAAAAPRSATEALGYDIDAACFISPAVLEKDVAPEALHLDSEGRWLAIAGQERPEHSWSLGYLTDRFPETEAALREAYAEDQPPLGAWWRRVDGRYERR